MDESGSDVSVHSSASNTSIAFSNLDDQLTLKVFGIDCSKVLSHLWPVGKMISLERETPTKLLESCYFALVQTITTTGFPTLGASKSERTYLLHGVLVVSFTLAAKVFQKHVQTPCAKPFEMF